MSVELELKMIEFTRKNAFPMGLRLDAIANQGAPEADTHLASLALKLGELAKELAKGEINGKFDVRLLRAHLMLEELGESLGSLAFYDEVSLLDGLTDLLYVVVGTAITYDLPIERAFDEVHRSNMTKQRKGDDPRLRDKGAAYEPPELTRILQTFRAENKNAGLRRDLTVAEAIAEAKPILGERAGAGYWDFDGRRRCYVGIMAKNPPYGIWRHVEEDSFSECIEKLKKRHSLGKATHEV